MVGKKDRIANWVYRSGILRFSCNQTGKFCFVLNYHRIRAAEAHSTLFDEGVFGPTQQEFEAQVKWLKDNSDILSENDLIAVVRGEILPPRRSAVVTFDDGYIDNHTLAYPILRHHKVPALFFIPTKAIEERCLGWWDCIAYILKTTKVKEFGFEGKRLRPNENYQEAIHVVLQNIYKNKPDMALLLGQLQDVCKTGVPPKHLQDGELMNWDQLREVSQNGITIGAHTHSHTILSGLDCESQKQEIEVSKQIIENRLGKRVMSMSYPVGTYSQFTIDTKKITASAGYQLAFSFLTGINTY